jgi:hypothetical protein
MINNNVHPPTIDDDDNNDNEIVCLSIIPGWRGTLLQLPLLVVSQVSLVNGGLNDDDKSYYPAKLPIIVHPCGEESNGVTRLAHHTYVGYYVDRYVHAYGCTNGKRKANVSSSPCLLPPSTHSLSIPTYYYRTATTGKFK